MTPYEFYKKIDNLEETPGNLFMIFILAGAFLCIIVFPVFTVLYKLFGLTFLIIPIGYLIYWAIKRAVRTGLFD